jgi:hypothetical protein
MPAELAAHGLGESALPGQIIRQAGGAVDPNILSTLRSPIQKFRWVHFPRNAELDGDFTYRVAPVFMNDRNELSYGEPQEVAIELRRDTYPAKLNIAFTRGFTRSIRARWAVITSRAERSLRRILVTSSIALKSHSSSDAPAVGRGVPDCAETVLASPCSVLAATAAIPSV